MRNTSRNRIALEWARLNLPPEQYNAIKKSFDATTTRTLIFVLCCIPIMLAFLSLIFIAPFSSSSIPKDASYSKTARVDYDGNFYMIIPKDDVKNICEFADETHDTTLDENFFEEHGGLKVKGSELVRMAKGIKNLKI